MCCYMGEVEHPAAERPVVVGDKRHPGKIHNLEAVGAGTVPQTGSVLHIDSSAVATVTVSVATHFVAATVASENHVKHY